MSLFHPFRAGDTDVCNPAQRGFFIVMNERQISWKERVHTGPSLDGGFTVRRNGIMRLVGLDNTQQSEPLKQRAESTRRMNNTTEQSFSTWTENLLEGAKKEYPDLAVERQFATEQVDRENGKISTHQTYDMVLHKKSQQELQQEGIAVPERKEEETKERLTRIAMDLIRQHSVAGDKEGLNGVVEVVLQEVMRSVAESTTDKPLFVRLHDVDGTKSLMIATDAESLEKPITLFLGHLDVVGASNGKNQFEPEIQEVEENGVKKKYLWGRGSVDMKGADTAMLDAVLRERPDDTQLLLTTTEETGSNDDTAFLAPRIHPDVVVVPDGARGGKYITKAKGFLHATLRADGESAHGGRPWDGADAGDPIIEARNMLRQLPYAHPTELTDGTTLVLTETKTGKNGDYVENPHNSTSAFGRQKMDLRYMDETERTKFEETLQEIWNNIKENSRYAGITFYDPEFPAQGQIFDTHADDVRVQLFVKQCADNGVMLEPAIEEGNTDARFFGTKEKPVPALVIRMEGTKTHSSNEMAELESIFFFRDRFAQLAQTLADEKKKVAA